MASSADNLNLSNLNYYPLKLFPEEFQKIQKKNCQASRIQNQFQE